MVLRLAIVALWATLWSGSSLLDAAEVGPSHHCIRAAPRQLFGDQADRLCAHSGTRSLHEGPARCASAAMSGSFGATVNGDFVSDLIELCEWAVDVYPAQCWSSVPKDWRKHVISACKHAINTQPAQCLLAFKRHGLVGSLMQQAHTITTVAQICRNFRGDPAAIAPCLAQAPRSLPEIRRFQLCRYGSPHTIPEIVSCARQLLERNANAGVVVDVCATAADKDNNAPQMCVLAAQQQLRWMDSESIAHLCRSSHATAAPVQCAAAIRSWFTTEFSRTQPLMDLARLCHRASTAESVKECVKKLPSRLFTASQVVRLCAEPPAREVSNGLNADCVVAASRQLFGFRSDANGGVSRDDQAALLLQLCEDVSSSSSVVDCLVATSSHRPALSIQQRARLCQGATSLVPYHCLHGIQSAILQRLPGTTSDAVEICREATTLAPAQCINQLHHLSEAFFQSGLATKLCIGATSIAPTLCFAAAPAHLSDHDKIVLCALAESEAPATCARVSLPRVRLDAHKAQLCAQATSTAPAQCASSSPFGMLVEDILSLCTHAVDDKPAQCARVVAPHLQIPWRDVAAVCRAAMSTMPGSCLSHRVRQRVLLSAGAIHECRHMTSTASSMEIAQFAYECPELMPKCPFSMMIRILDQFSGDMPTLSQGYVYFSVVPDSDLSANELPVRGHLLAPIVNGSAIFQELHFTVSGNFTLRWHALGMEDMVARLRVHSNETEQRELRHCQRIFSLMQCDPVHQVDIYGSSSQILLLPHSLAIGGLHCESLWADQHGGLRLLGGTPHARLYTLPRMAYQLLNGLNIPTSLMSPWECLGIPEGSNRSVIRRAYHRRSLEWHPDKWTFISSTYSSSVSTLQAKVEEVYTLVNNAYQQLAHPA